VEQGSREFTILNMAASEMDAINNEGGETYVDRYTPAPASRAEANVSGGY
jgi:hypothetical protein